MTQILLSVDFGYINDETAHSVKNLSNDVGRLINALIARLKSL